ncbi:hypothetical protein ONZ45_g8003 [Pleurotus djamor]|nr:hypothetical protein ONZ45_g8003 [Pleurotus djamor]
MSTTIGRYIVLFKPHVSIEEIKQYAEEIKRSGGRITHTYDIIKGFAAEIPEPHLASLQSLQSVDSIELDGFVTTQA